jgi:hypothetical protein
VVGGLWTSFVGNLEWRSSELGLAAAIGGGRAGLTGQLDARYLVGWRGYVTDWQGPFVRVGVDSQFVASSFLTLLSVPAAVVGYEVIEDGLAFDVGLHGAFALGGEYSVYRGSSRDVSDSPVLGAYAWMIAGPVQTGVQWDRLWPHNQAALGHDAIDNIRTSACVGAAQRFALLLCATLGLTSGPAALPAGPGLFETTAIVQSLTVGYGFVAAHAQAPRRIPVTAAKLGPDG